MYEYKVLTERDKRFTGGFDPDTLEATLNSYAAEGWRLVQAVSAANMMKTAKAEMIMILERTTAGTSLTKAVMCFGLRQSQQQCVSIWVKHPVAGCLA